MSSPFEELNDTWSERKKREKQATRRRWLAQGKIALCVMSVALATGVGTAFAGAAEEDHNENVIPRIISGLVGGLVCVFLVISWAVFRLVYESAKRDVLGHEGEERDLSRLFILIAVGGAWLGGLFGSGAFPHGSEATLIGGLLGGGGMIVLIGCVLIVRGFAAKSRRI